jgi:hypothetical protein
MFITPLFGKPALFETRFTLHQMTTTNDTFTAFLIVGSLYLFVGTIVAGYSVYVTRHIFGRGMAKPFDDQSSFLYLTLSALQGFSAGVFLLAVYLENVRSSFVAFKMVAGMMACVIIVTAFIRYLKPKWASITLPISVFLAGGEFARQGFVGLYGKPLAQKFSEVAAQFAFLDKLSVPTISHPVIVFLMAVCAFYFIARPIFAFRWGGVPFGSALNTLIAIFLAIAPFAAAGSEAKFTSIFECFQYPGGILTFLMWSWIIGNVISWAIVAIKGR